MLRISKPKCGCPVVSTPSLIEKIKRAMSPKISTIKVGSITQPLGAETARSWLVVDGVVFIRASFRVNRKNHIEMIS